ncbi:MAG TPA: DUF456 domain-containing protein [Bacteroidales bacterium]|nr:DUF456 domain-containing protein [Bacteroidales bacterium]HOX78611.1 DUF456 domain-containing protein [Bacteroidales bacterium]HPM92249.1 DUF456 domain-containing protein [Bacteroidales bacterium]
MEWLLIVIGILLVLAGIAGAVLPGLPGPPLSFIALVLLQFRDEPAFGEDFMILMGLIMIAVTVLDYVIPVYGAKKFGGTKKGVWGSTIGLVAGLFLLPALGIVIGPFGLIGIIIFPFLGAYIGEKMSGRDSDTALKAAFGTFIGFLAGTVMKLVYSIVAAVYFFIGIF